jgi:hypothetical protein
MFGSGPTRREVDAELARRGFEVTDDRAGDAAADLVVHCAAPGEAVQMFIRMDGACDGAGVPCLHIAVESGRILIGPLFVPARTACFLCSRAFVRCLEGDRGGEEGRLAPWMSALAATAAVDELAAFLAAGDNFRMASHVVISTYRRASPHRNLLDTTHTPTTAACAICRAPARAEGAAGPALPCFIVGSQRSGTTMLGLALGAHDEVELLDEDRAYAALAGHALPRAAILKVPRWTAAVSFFAAHFPSAGFLFLRRPAHQVVASMLSLRGFAGASWADLFAAIEARVAAAGFASPAVREVVEEHIRRAAGDAMLAATVCAVAKQELVAEYRRAGLRALEIDYERLVRDPASTLAGVLDFVGLPWSDAVLDPGRRSSGTTVGQTERGRAIDADSLDKHTRVLGQDGLDRVRRLEQELLADLARARQSDA